MRTTKKLFLTSNQESRSEKLLYKSITFQIINLYLHRQEKKIPNGKRENCAEKLYVLYATPTL